MAKSKKTSTKHKSRAKSSPLSQPTMFISGMVWVVTTLSFIYLGMAYWRFG
jgi:hypothetical protein